MFTGQYFLYTNIKNYPKELTFLQSNSSDDKSTFIYLDTQIHNIHCTIRFYDKRDDFDFDIVSFGSFSNTKNRF